VAGEGSRGKASTQQLFPLPSGAAVFVTTAQVPLSSYTLAHTRSPARSLARSRSFALSHSLYFLSRPAQLSLSLPPRCLSLLVSLPPSPPPPSPSPPLPLYPPPSPSLSPPLSYSHSHSLSLSRFLSLTHSLPPSAVRHGERERKGEREISAVFVATARACVVISLSLNCRRFDQFLPKNRPLLRSAHV
jgi:hypothetical protein